MQKYTEATESNTKTIIESNQQLTKTLAEIHQTTSKTPHDPNTANLRQKLNEDLERENCVLTITGSTETVEGKTGWLKLQFRNGFDASKFGSGILKTVMLPHENRFTTLTFVSKHERDLFSRNIERKNQPLKFFDSYPQPYRQPSKQLRKTAQNRRDMGFITEVSIDESSLIMFLKYRDKKKNNDRFDWQIYQSYDPFDKDNVYNKSLKASKILNKTAILIKPKYGTQVTQETLKTELEKFSTANSIPLQSHDPVVSEKHISMQFDNPEDAETTHALFETSKSTFLQGNCNINIM